MAMATSSPIAKPARPPTVVRIRRMGGKTVQDCDVYIGRHMYQGGWRLKKSEWYNPHSVKKCGSALEACLKFAEYLFDGAGKVLQEQLPCLAGKTLGCWCKRKFGDYCHGDVIVIAFELIVLNRTPKDQKLYDLIHKRCGPALAEIQKKING
ncbi:uncharacterized protein LOC143025011 [Oratosquilla oratoria]|uniref:uncharacterized protein LOC143025011 n=1 Tax=Oratosquilla oratoria TaxID=337810 RepID=UPI003F774D64